MLAEREMKELNDKQKFYIKDGKLIICFDPSEIAPTKYGELQFEMPFNLDENCRCSGM